ncbi:MAG: ATP-binding cassette domain-containing protein [Candidatus Caldarchaeum sp.]
MVRISVQDLKKVFTHKVTGQNIVAIDKLNFEIDEGEVVSIVGKTGCGKSTFLSILLGIVKPTSGKILVDGKEPYKDFYHFRGKIAAIFQQDILLPWRTALENVKIGLEILRYPKEKQLELARHWLAKVGLERFINSYPGELSGGMRQRVAIARAFVVDPEVLLADEAFGHLDVVTATVLRNDFIRLVKEQRKTAIMVTHQLDDALDTGGRILVFGRPARLIADVKIPDDVKDNPVKKNDLKEQLYRLIEESG